MTLIALFESFLTEAAVDDMRDRFHANHGLHPEVFNHLYHNALPDNNKSLGDMEWLANREVAGEGVAENHEHVKRVMTEFAKPAIKDKLQKKKANQYKTFGDLEAAVSPHVGTAPTKAEMEDADTKVIHKSDTHIIRQHFSHGSMVKAASLQKENPYHGICQGKATWCVSAESELGKQRYDQYTEGQKHPFYTIEHTSKHPTMPNRKFAVLADPRMDIENHEFRDERQLNRIDVPEYIMKNRSIMHTAPGQYIGKLVGFAHGSKEMTFVKGRTKHKITFNDDFSSHHIENNGSTTTEYSRNSFGETHGIMKTTSNNGTPISLTTYENGKLNGPKISYYKTGKISGKTNYKNGELHGLQKSYHENGNLQNESNFHEGNQIGTEKSYFPSGNLESVIENDEKGNFIRSSHYYPHNRPEGNPLYRTKEKVPYGNGHAMKIHKYYENGQLMSTGIFHKGLEEGEHLDFHENGNIARIKKYKAGELHGIHKDFDENGNLKAERLYKNGNLLRENEHGDNLEFIKRRHDNLYGTQIDASENEHSITLHKLVVLKNLRKKGYGSNAMRDITNYADMTGKKVVLTPSTDFGATSVSRLTKFYKGHGFVENKGRNKDFEVSHTMYRNPDKSLFESRKKSSFRSIIER